MIFSAPPSALETGMRGGVLIQCDQQFAYGFVCCYSWAAPCGAFPTVSLFTFVTPPIQSRHGCSPSGAGVTQNVNGRLGSRLAFLIPDRNAVGGVVLRMVDLLYLAGTETFMFQKPPQGTQGVLKQGRRSGVFRVGGVAIRYGCPAPRRSRRVRGRWRF